MTGIPGTVLITGTTSGVGLNATKALVDRGWTVITANRSPQRAAAAADALDLPKERLQHVLMDLGDLDRVQKAVAALPDRIDACVCTPNADGVFGITENDAAQVERFAESAGMDMPYYLQEYEDVFRTFSGATEVNVEDSPVKYAKPSSYGFANDSGARSWKDQEVTPEAHLIYDGQGVSVAPSDGAWLPVKLRNTMC